MMLNLPPELLLVGQKSHQNSNRILHIFYTTLSLVLSPLTMPTLFFESAYAKVSTYAESKAIVYPLYMKLHTPSVPN